MNTIPPVHLVVMQPAGYVHSLGFLDQARYLRHQFRRFGAEVTLAKNRLREDAVNIVFGAHLGFPVAWKQRHACIFFNLEQLGAGGAKVGDDYLKLLRSSAVVDYDAANLAAYAADPAEVPVVPFLHAPYLEPEGDELPLEQRPIDLLFFGSMNPRRQAFLQRIESCGVKVTGLAHALYGPERDRLVRQAKAVINCHFYETSRFEQARAFHCLSLGTPFVSERGPNTVVPAGFEDAVQWLRGDDGLEQYFRHDFRSAAGFDAARARLAAWREHDPMEAYADLLAFAAGYLEGHRQSHDGLSAWRPRQMQLETGAGYRPGWLNLDREERHEPDIVADLGAEPLQLPLDLGTRFGSPLRLEAGGLERLCAGRALERSADADALVGNALALLQVGGELQLDLQCGPGLDASVWQPWCDGYAERGWFEHRFELARSRWLDARSQPCEPETAATLEVVLRKRETTLAERMHARTWQAGFGGVPDDLPAGEPEAVAAPAAAATSSTPH